MELDIEQLKMELEDANERIAELEEQLEESSMGVVFSESEKFMLEIIKREIKGLDDKTNQVYKDPDTGEEIRIYLGKDDIKKFDTLVKDFVALRGKMPVVKNTKNEEDADDIADLISIVEG